MQTNLRQDLKEFMVVNVYWNKVGTLARHITHVLEPMTPYIIVVLYNNTIGYCRMMTMPTVFRIWMTLYMLYIFTRTEFNSFSMADNDVGCLSCMGSIYQEVR